MNYVDSLNLFGVEAKEIPCIKDSGIPTTSTEGAVGLFYMNTDNGDIYKCVAATSDTYTWEILLPKVSGTEGQAIGFDANGNMVAVPFTTTEIVVDNLIDYSNGWTSGVGQMSGPVDLTTLEVPYSTGVQHNLSYAYNKLIPIEPNTTYAFSKGYTIQGTLFLTETGGKSVYITNNVMTDGGDCLLYTTPNPVNGGYYLAISIFRGNNEDLSKFKIVKGSSLTSGKVILHLDESIKTNIAQVDGLEDRLKTIEQDGTHNVTVTGPFDASTIFDTLQPTARKIQNYQSPTTLTIALMADTHFADTDVKANEELDAAKMMGTLGDLCTVDLIGSLGDMIPGNAAEEVSRGYLARLTVATTQNAKCPVLFARGNHDDNGWYSYGGYGGNYEPYEIINDKEWYQAVWGINAKHFVTDPNRPYGAYGYYDHEPSKIRVFVLNTEDIPYIQKSDGTYRYNCYSSLHSFSNEQINFIANALYFADKENPNEWAALFMGHVPVDSTNDNGYRFGFTDALIRGHETLLAVIAAYRKGTSFSYSGNSAFTSDKFEDRVEDFPISVNVDYSTKGAGDVIGFFNGHTHADNFSRSVGYENSLTRGYAYIGLIGWRDFATFVIDRENNMITSIKHGTVYPEQLEGTVVDAPDFGNIADGEWSVTIDQFRPDGTNLYNGVSEIHASGSYPDNSSKVNVTTLEVDTTPQSGGYVTTKAIKVKPFTRYAIPSNFNGLIRAFNSAGGGSVWITPTVEDGYKVVTTGISHYYLVFCHHTGSYTDYENFKIKEIYSGLEF